jgi:hypothetical protein
LPPAVPHDVASVPAMHVLPTQQPLQFVASQRATLQVRPFASHARPWSSQFVQFAPPMPHAAASLPARHRWRPSSKLQHPLGQVAGPHAGSSRPQTRLPVQTAKPDATQSEHRPPSAPHARASLPVRHTPLASQHPFGHVDGLQTPGGVPPSPSVSGSRLDRPHPGIAKTSAAAARKKIVKKRPNKASGEKRMRSPSRAGA